MTKPIVPVNSVGVSMPETGTPDSVAGIASRVDDSGEAEDVPLGAGENATTGEGDTLGLDDAFKLALGVATIAGSPAVRAFTIENFREIFCSVLFVSIYDTVIVFSPSGRSAGGVQSHVPS